MKAITPAHSASPARRKPIIMATPSCVRSSFSRVACDLIRKGSAIRMMRKNPATTYGRNTASRFMAVTLDTDLICV